MAAKRWERAVAPRGHGDADRGPALASRPGNLPGPCGNPVPGQVPAGRARSRPGLSPESRAGRDAPSNQG